MIFAYRRSFALAMAPALIVVSNAAWAAPCTDPHILLALKRTQSAIKGYTDYENAALEYEKSLNAPKKRADFVSAASQSIDEVALVASAALASMGVIGLMGGGAAVAATGEATATASAAAAATGASEGAAGGAVIGGTLTESQLAAAQKGIEQLTKNPVDVLASSKLGAKMSPTGKLFIKIVGSALPAGGLTIMATSLHFVNDGSKIPDSFRVASAADLENLKDANIHQSVELEKNLDDFNLKVGQALSKLSNQYVKSVKQIKWNFFSPGSDQVNTIALMQADADAQAKIYHASVVALNQYLGHLNDLKYVCENVDKWRAAESGAGGSSAH